jgi:hypothetical protein
LKSSPQKLDLSKRSAGEGEFVGEEPDMLAKGFTAQRWVV